MGSGDTEKQFHKLTSELIALLYEAAIDPPRWEDFLRRFAEAEGRRLVSPSHTSLGTPVRDWLDRMTPGFGAARESALLATLEPHLERARALHCRLSMLDMELSVSRAALDHLAVGIAVVRSNGQVIFLNRAAREILGRNDGLTIGPAGLECTSAELAHLLREAADVAQAPPVRKVLRIPRAGGRRPLHLIAVPLNPREEIHLAAAGAAASCVAALITDPEATIAADWTEIRRLLSLTPAEARVASHLISGMNVEETAAALQLSISTARTHLKHVLAKTGTRRQAELIHLLLRTFAGLREEPGDTRRPT